MYTKNKVVLQSFPTNSVLIDHKDEVKLDAFLSGCTSFSVVPFTMPLIGRSVHNWMLSFHVKFIT